MVIAYLAARSMRGRTIDIRSLDTLECRFVFGRQIGEPRTNNSIRHQHRCCFLKLLGAFEARWKVHTHLAALASEALKAPSARARTLSPNAVTAAIINGDFMPSSVLKMVP